VGVVRSFGHGSFGSRHVEFNQFFNAFESFAGQAKQSFEVGFVGSDDLFYG
jgi:hypothetical protein